MLWGSPVPRRIIFTTRGLSGKQGNKIPGTKDSGCHPRSEAKGRETRAKFTRRSSQGLASLPRATGDTDPEPQKLPPGKKVGLAPCLGGRTAPRCLSSSQLAPPVPSWPHVAPPGLTCSHLTSPVPSWPHVASPIPTWLPQAPGLCLPVPPTHTPPLAHRPTTSPEPAPPALPAPASAAFSREVPPGGPHTSSRVLTPRGAACHQGPCARGSWL